MAFDLLFLQIGIPDDFFLIRSKKAAVFVESTISFKITHIVNLPLAAFPVLECFNLTILSCLS
jgi:hypothetical protein